MTAVLIGFLHVLLLVLAVQGLWAALSWLVLRTPPRRHRTDPDARESLETARAARRSLDRVHPREPDRRWLGFR